MQSARMIPPPYLGEPRRTETRLVTVIFETGGDRMLYLPMDDIPRQPITGLEVLTNTSLRRLPVLGGVAVSPLADLADCTLTLVNRKNEQVISDLPLGSIAYNLPPAPARFTWRRKVFRVFDVDPTRSYVRFNPTGLLKTIVIGINISFGP